MGISFEAPLALLLLIPALGADVRAVPRRPAPARARGGGGSPSSSGRCSSSPSCFALAGFRLVLPVDRLATVFVVDLSDSVGNDGREDALAFLRETPRRHPGRGRGGHRRVRQGRARRAAAVGPRRDRPASPRRRSARRPTSARRSGWPPRCSPTTPRSGSSCCPTATTRPAAGQAEAALAAARDIRIETRLIGLGASDEVLVERLTTPSTVEPRRVGRGDRRDPLDGRPAGDGPPVRQRRAGRRPQRVEPRGRRRPASSSTSTPDGGRVPHVPGRRRGGARHVQRERPGRLEHDRQGRAADAGPGRRRGRRRRARRGARERSARTSTRSSPRRCRPTSRRSRRTTASSSSTCRGPGCRTGSWPRCRSTSATSARAW